MTWHTRGLTIDHPDQVVIESEPYRRLSYTWHTFTTEWAESLDLSDDARNRLTAEPRSKVTFEIEPLGEQVKLTVIHDDLVAGRRGRLADQRGMAARRGQPQDAARDRRDAPGHTAELAGEARTDAMTNMQMTPTLPMSAAMMASDDAPERGSRDRAPRSGARRRARGAAVRRLLPRHLGDGRRRDVPALSAAWGRRRRRPDRRRRAATSSRRSSASAGAGAALRLRSGLRFGVYCCGSSIGLMVVLVAVDVMSIALMVAIAVVVLAQKLFPPHRALDVPLALAIVALGVAIAAT